MQGSNFNHLPYEQIENTHHKWINSQHLLIEVGNPKLCRNYKNLSDKNKFDTAYYRIVIEASNLKRTIKEPVKCKKMFNKTYFMMQNDDILLRDDLDPYLHNGQKIRSVG